MFFVPFSPPSDKSIMVAPLDGIPYVHEDLYFILFNFCTTDWMITSDLCSSSLIHSS
jgi:hypothetical protein